MKSEDNEHIFFRRFCRANVLKWLQDLHSFERLSYFANVFTKEHALHGGRNSRVVQWIYRGKALKGAIKHVFFRLICNLTMIHLK